MNLEQLSIKALVAIRNDLNPASPVKSFSQKSVAVEAIAKLAKAKGVNVSKQYNEEGKRVVEVEPKQPVKKEKKEKKEKKLSIRAAAEPLLLEVVGKDEDGRNVGMPYLSIIEALRQQFPGSVTTVACLRWYAVKMRAKGRRVPNRPRSKTESPE